MANPDEERNEENISGNSFAGIAARRSPYPSPLDKLMSSEKSRIVRERMGELDQELRNLLSITEYGLLVSIMGLRWHDQFGLPGLEFAEDTADYVNKKLFDVKERLQIMLEASEQFSDPRKVLHLAMMPYFLTTKQEAIDVYQKVLETGSAFPRNFFRYDEGRKSGVLIRYMYEQRIGYSPEEVLTRATKSDFQANGLGSMLQTHFHNSVPAAVKNAYPPSKYSDLYVKKMNGHASAPAVFGGLTHLVDSLDDMFNTNRKSK